jgi:hypothetical protein
MQTDLDLDGGVDDIRRFVAGCRVSRALSLLCDGY